MKNFTEKPKPAKAQQLIRKGSLWNSGIFVWKASTLLELLSRYQPDISSGLEVIRKAANGKWISLSAKNCLIHAPERLVVLLGLENTVVVDTPDALLVGDLSRSQEVKELVEELKKKGYGSYTIK